MLKPKIESEKVLERYLCAEVKKLGGWAIKLLSGLVTGLPDRLILLPGGVVAFVEVKTTGKKASAIQLVRLKQLMALGFRVEVLDSKEGINNFINSFKPPVPTFSKCCGRCDGVNDICISDR